MANVSAILANSCNRETTAAAAAAAADDDDDDDDNYDEYFLWYG